MFMKKFLPLFAFYVLFAVSCAEDEPDCMSCHIEVTDLETGEKKSQSAQTYCDEKLDAILTQDAKLGTDMKSEYVCK